ncbi:hypothetical protein TNCV_4646431 [Trichonephila clavipes]|uniref:Uncharacterized protein n=1 Tax=Trichonephila clavipes TaxID=2585209 RepID=A0A8X6T1M1_TRICX|nr:hypothetical protein TNCV_4646431 [Trichonephila clavipes]
MTSVQLKSGCAEKGKLHWRLQMRESPLNWLRTYLLKVGNWADQEVDISLGFALWTGRVSEKLSMTGLWSDESSGMDSMVKGKLKLLMRAKSNVLEELYPYLVGEFGKAVCRSWRHLQVDSIGVPGREECLDEVVEDGSDCSIPSSIFVYKFSSISVIRSSQELQINQ